MISRLNNRALLKLSGNDVQAFLQGQFSNDIDALTQNEVQLNAYCQHQGKIIALIWLMRKKDDFYLSFPQDLSAVVIKRLTMFKMMSDVHIEDISASMVQLGTVDTHVQEAFRLNERQSVVLADNADAVDWEDDTAWEQACVENSIPEVYLDTSEKFVPQLLNLDINESGVNFSKGCYPGQEVVARLHYLGKSKRRMRQFKAGGKIHINDELMVEGSKSARASGIVVRCVELDRESHFLATVEVAFENEDITINAQPITKIFDD